MKGSGKLVQAAIVHVASPTLQNYSKDTVSV